MINEKKSKEEGKKINEEDYTYSAYLPTVMSSDHMVQENNR